MTAKVEPIDRQITARIRQEMPKIQGRIFEGDAPQGGDIPIDTLGRVQPYVVAIYGGLMRVQQSYRGITSTRNDIKHHTMLFLVTASSLKQANDISDDLRDALEGYEPEGATELFEETSGNAKYPADSTLKPTRYTNMLAFSLLVNP